MPSARRLAVAVLLLASAACALPRGRGGRVRVRVFNVHAGRDASGRPNLEAVAALVRSTSADLVLLQEVDRGTKRSGAVDQVAVMARRTGMAAAFGRTLDYDGGEYGIAALSRPGFAGQETLPLEVSPVQARAGGSHEPRAALVTIVPTRLGRWHVVTTHLDASTGDDYREQEADRLGEILRDRGAADMPFVLGGDMNATPDSAVVRKLLGLGLRDAWTECGRGDGLTYPSGEPRKRIDYLFLAGRLRCTDARVLETTISDHRPLLVTVAAP